MIKQSIFFALATMLTFSCSDPCKDVKCNFGDCIEGSCACYDGYEGENCDTAIRAKYIGVWNGPLLDCFPDSIVSGLDSFDLFMGTSIVFTPSQENIEDLEFNIPNPLTQVSSTAKIENEVLSVSPAIIGFQFMDFPIALVLTGSGRLLNENELEMTIILNIPLIGTNECTIILTRQ